MKKLLFQILFFLFAVSAFSQTRSLEEVFPNLSSQAMSQAFTEEGFIRSSRTADRSDIINQNSGIDPQILKTVLAINPGVLVESLIIIPIEGVNLLDAYNALNNVRDLSGRLFFSESRGREIPLFEDATRITPDRRSTPIPDPPRAAFIPETEIVYLRLRDANFGNSFYRADMALTEHGLRYSLTNTRALTAFFVTAIREGNFIAQLYFEIIHEGILIYSIAGTNVSNFVANRVHMPSAITKRLEVINSWVVDGILGRN